MKMSLIPPAHITKVWPSASGYLDRASRAVRQRHDVVDIFEDCLTGRQLLWVIFDEDNDNDIVGALTTSCFHYPRYRAMTIPYMGGDMMMKYRDLVIEVLSKFARENGFSTIEGYGRDAWGRLGDKYGFKKAYSMFELDLSETDSLAAE